MKTKAKNISINLFFFILILLIFVNRNLVSIASNDAINLWLKKVFPSLFPFFILSDILTNFGFIELLNKTFGNLFTKIFKISPTCTYIFLLSLLSGTPTSAFITKKLYLKKEITSQEGTKILCFSFFSNPLFLLTMLSFIFPNNLVLIITLIIIHYLTNIIIGLLIRNKIKTSPSIPHKQNQTNNNLGSILTTSISTSLNTCLMILGTITFYIIITSLITKIIPIPPTIKTFLSGILELTQGLNNLSSIYTTTKIKALIASFIINFGSLSIHTQIKSIINDTPIKYKPFFISRITASIIATTLTYIYFL